MKSLNVMEQKSKHSRVESARKTDLFHIISVSGSLLVLLPKHACVVEMGTFSPNEKDFKQPKLQILVSTKPPWNWRQK
jgi:hypothetical protein